MSDAGDTQKRPERVPGPWETEHLIDPRDVADADALLDDVHEAELVELEARRELEAGELFPDEAPDPRRFSA